MEQPLPPYGACLLGSINLVKFIANPFSVESSVLWGKLDEVVATAVRMMDNVVDVSNYPLEQQMQEAFNKRRIGLGVTGLADALVMLGLTYGDEDALNFVDLLMRNITAAAYEASVALAREKGAFPLFDAEKYCDSEFVKSLPFDIQDSIREFGIRNSHLTSIAPTGTISIYAGNVSSGIEPIFATSYTRKVLQPDGSRTEEKVEDYAVGLWNDLHEQGEMLPRTGRLLPKTFVTAQDLPPEAHVKMQAVVQKHIDSSISKTVNLPADISFEAFKDVYVQAYDLGCKGCTTYRPNDITGSVLSVEPAAAAPQPEADKPVADQLEPRPEALRGVTYKLKWPQDTHAIYITINDDGVKPLEVFFNTKNVEHQAWMVALARTISAVFRRGGEVGFMATELKEIADPKGGSWVGGKYVPSLIAAIGNVIQGHIDGLNGTHTTFTEVYTLQGDLAAMRDLEQRMGDPCPSCGEYTMKKEAGCETCTSCAYSKCG